MQRRLLIALLAVWTLFAWAGPGHAEPAFPRGLRVGLEPAGNLTLSTRLPGFADEDLKAIVAILDLPGMAYGDLEQSMFTEQSGLADLKRESFPFANGIGFLASGHVTVQGVTVYKWFLLASAIGNPSDLATVVSVEVPETARAIYTDAAVRKMLASVTFRAPPIEEQLKFLPFVVGDYAGFRPIKVLPSGGVIMIDGPGDDLNSQAYMIVSIERGGPNEPGDRVNFVRELLASSPLRDMQLQSNDTLRLNGQPTYETKGQARSLTGAPVSVVQWVKFGQGGFMRIIGVAPKNIWDGQYPRFRAVRDSLSQRAGP